jgi:hypothetical protein
VRAAGWKQVLNLDSIVEQVLVVLLKLHSAYAGVDEAITEQFARGLAALGCVLVVLGGAASHCPMWLVLSVGVTAAFGARHPLIAPPVESIWVAHGAGAVQVQLTWMLAGALLLPVLLVAEATERAMVSVGVSVALAGAGCIARRRGRRSASGAAAGDTDADHAPTGASGGIGAYMATADAPWLGVQRCWEMLPAPAIRNTADGSDS